MKRKDEDENYFKNKLSFNYIYKPRYIQKEFANDFKDNKNLYHQIISLLPTKGKILDLGCGYGVLSFLLVYDYAQRTVWGWDEDADKTKIAQNTFTVNRFPVTFIQELPETFSDFDFLITHSESDYQRLKNLVNLDHWEIIFDQSTIKVFKNTDGRRI